MRWVYWTLNSTETFEIGQKYLVLGKQRSRHEKYPDPGLQLMRVVRAG